MDPTHNKSRFGLQSYSNDLRGQGPVVGAGGVETPVQSQIQAVINTISQHSNRLNDKRSAISEECIPGIIDTNRLGRFTPISREKTKDDIDKERYNYVTSYGCRYFFNRFLSDDNMNGFKRFGFAVASILSAIPWGVSRLLGTENIRPMTFILCGLPVMIMASKFAANEKDVVKKAIQDNMYDLNEKLSPRIGLTFFYPHSLYEELDPDNMDKPTLKQIDNADKKNIKDQLTAFTDDITKDYPELANTSTMRKLKAHIARLND